MSGRSGSAVAPHTPLVQVGSTTFSVSVPQARLIRRVMDNGGRMQLNPRQLRSAGPLPLAICNIRLVDGSELLNNAVYELVLADGVVLRGTYPLGSVDRHVVIGRIEGMESAPNLSERRMATNFSKHFTTQFRNDSDPESGYVTLKGGRPDWLQDAVRQAHRGTLPNDWIYQECRAAVEAFDAGNLTDEDSAHEYTDIRVDPMTKSLFQWAADFCLTETWSSAHEEARDMGMPDDIEKQIAAVQYAAILHIAETMLEACEKRVSEPETA